MSISLKLIDSNTKIAKDINKALALEINRIISKNARIVQNKLKQRIPSWIKEQTEIVSLGNDGQLGSLNAQFGLEFGTSDSAISAIANAVADSTQVKITNIYILLKDTKLLQFLHAKLLSIYEYIINTPHLLQT